MGAEVESFHEGGICTCGYQIPMRGTIANQAYNEPRFLGGYRITHGMESIYEILRFPGVTDNKTFENVWTGVMNSNYMATYHERLENIPRYLETVDEFGSITGTENKSARINNYLKDAINDVSSRVEKVLTPRMYFTMRKLFISMHAKKQENKLVEIAGGIGLNKEINSGERSNSTTSVEEINETPRQSFSQGIWDLPSPDIMTSATRMKLWLIPFEIIGDHVCKGIHGDLAA